MLPQNMINKSGKRSQPIRLEAPQYVRNMTFLRIESRFVAVMHTAQADRGMVASEFHTRCVQRSEVHELICMRQDESGLVDLNDAWYLGFIEFSSGCVLAKGMRFEYNGKKLGTLVAFDMTHTPNHLNILLATPRPRTGREQGIQAGDFCCIFAGAGESS